MQIFVLPSHGGVQFCCTESSLSCSTMFAVSSLAKNPKMTKPKLQPLIYSTFQHLYSCLNLKLTFHEYSSLPVSTKVLPNKWIGFEENKFKERETANSTLGFPSPPLPPKILSCPRGPSPLTGIFHILYLIICLGMCWFLRWRGKTSWAAEHTE